MSTFLKQISVILGNTSSVVNLIKNKTQVFYLCIFLYSGTMLHFPSPSGLACPSRSVSFRSDSLWNFLDMEKFQQPDDKIWKLQYIPANAKLQETTEYLEIKMSRDTKYNQMLSGGIFRPADLAEGGVYEVRSKLQDIQKERKKERKQE